MAEVLARQVSIIPVYSRRIPPGAAATKPAADVGIITFGILKAAD